MAIRAELVTDLIKKELKKKKLSYEDLAERLGMSPSGVKKALASKDLTLGRLQTLCDVAGLSLIQILTQADDTKVQDVYLTEEQETLLLREPAIFHLYWKLRFEQLPLHRYIKEASLDREVVRERLRRLEKVGLLKINAKGDLEFSDKGMIRWNNYGPLVQHLNREWSAQLIDSILRKKNPEIILNLALLQLSETSYGVLKADLRALLERHSGQSRKDQLQYKTEQLKRVALLLATDEHQFVK